MEEKLTKDQLAENEKILKDLLKSEIEYSKNRSDDEILFDLYITRCVEAYHDLYFLDKDRQSVEPVINRIKDISKLVEMSNYFLRTKYGEKASWMVYHMEHIMKVYEVTWANPKDNEDSIQHRIQSNLDDYFPGATLIAREYQIERRRCDFLIKLNNEMVLVEVKLGTVGNSALKQLQWYMDHSGIQKGVLVGSTLSDSVTLPDNISFLSYHRTEYK